MKYIIGLIAVTGIVLWFAVPHMREVLARGAAAGMVLGVILLVVTVIKAMWRAVRGISVDGVAHRAGALTDAAQRRASQAAQAFKDGRGR